MWLMFHYPHPNNLELSLSVAELDESSSRQSAAVAAVRQREEVGTDLWSGGSVTHLYETVGCSAAQVALNALWMHNYQTREEKKFFHSSANQSTSFTVWQSDSGVILEKVCPTLSSHAPLPCLYPVSLSRSLHSALASLIKWVKWRSREHTSVSQLKNSACYWHQGCM